MKRDETLPNALFLECTQDLVQLLIEHLGMIHVESECRPQSDGGVATTTAVYTLLTQVCQDGITPANCQLEIFYHKPI